MMDAVQRAIEIVNAVEWEGDSRVNLTTVIGAGRVLAKRIAALESELAELRDVIQQERDLSFERFKAANLWSITKSALIAAGCPLGIGSHVPTVVNDWLHLKLGDKYGRA